MPRSVRMLPLICVLAVGAPFVAPFSGAAAAQEAKNTPPVTQPVTPPVTSSKPAAAGAAAKKTTAAKPAAAKAAEPVAAAAPSPFIGDAVHGAKLYDIRCGGCHSVDSNRIGPMHRNVVGRKAGTIAGFAYSNQLKASKIVWTPANLDRWLSGPTKMVPGTRMGISVANPDERRDIIGYLASVSVSAN